MQNATTRFAIPLAADSLWPCSSPALFRSFTTLTKPRPWVWVSRDAKPRIASTSTRRSLETAAGHARGSGVVREPVPAGLKSSQVATDRDRKHWQKVETRRKVQFADWEQQVKREQESWKAIDDGDADALHRTRDGLVLRGYRSREELMAMLEVNSTEMIYHRMRFAARRGELMNVQRMVAYLITERDESPNLRLYASLILSHGSAAAGSALWVAAYLKEMREEGLEADSGLCHDVLKVLAVHPHHILRNEVLEYMRSKWYTLSPDGHHDVIAGCLRENSFEMAVDMIFSLQRAGTDVQTWLYDMAVHILCDAGEFEQALRIIQLRLSAAEQNISPTIWWSLLDSASSALNHECTNFVWKRRVNPGYLNPSSGTCLNALKIAARYGDVDLATDVFRVLGLRNTVFDHEQYELLLGAYMKGGDLEAALTVLCVMHDAGTPPDMGSVRQIVFYLQAEQSRRDQALELLQTLAEERTIPATAMNALIEATLWSRDLLQALEYYKLFHNVCKDGREIDTYNILLRACRSKDGTDKSTAMFLVSEMVAFKIKPNVITYDRLMLVCINEPNGDGVEDAFRYYFEMLAQGHKPRAGTLLGLAKRSAVAGDVRTPKLLEDLAAYGEDGQKAVVGLEKVYLRARSQDGAETLKKEAPASWHANEA